MMEEESYSFSPLVDYPSFPDLVMEQRSNEFYGEILKRRSIREFSDREVPFEVIEKCLLAAGTAPNGANLQPWHFAVVKDPTTKREIRQAAEKEEFEFYHGKAPQSWLDALAPLGTDESKPFLETAPYLIVVFAQAHSVDDQGQTKKNYYVSESVGIATGFLIAALHHCGLGTLTHTPSPMKFLNQILGRPSNERPFVLLVVGHPSESALVPDITKKSFDSIVSIH